VFVGAEQERELVVVGYIGVNVYFNNIVNDFGQPEGIEVPGGDEQQVLKEGLIVFEEDEGPMLS
jgi:hypothetical protein